MADYSHDARTLARVIEAATAMRATATRGFRPRVSDEIELLHALGLYFSAYGFDRDCESLERAICEDNGIDPDTHEPVRHVRPSCRVNLDPDLLSDTVGTIYSGRAA